MPISDLTSVKAALGITGSASDGRLTPLIAGAEAMIARRTGLLFTSTTIVEDHAGGTATLALRAFPVTAITSVVDLGSGQVLVADDYALETSIGLLRRLPFGRVWEGFHPIGPFTDQLGTSAGANRPQWRVTMVAGYATAPGDILTALLEIVASGLGQQGGKTSEKDGDYAVSYAAGATGIPPAAEAILSSYTRVL